MGELGIRAIEYRPWKGERTDPNRRWLVVSWHVFTKNMRAKAVIVLLIFGMMLAHAFPIIGALLFPHEEVTDEDMVGRDTEYEPGTDPTYSHNVTDGSLAFNGNLGIDGTFHIDGNVTVEGTLVLGGEMTGFGTLAGEGAFASQSGVVIVNGTALVRGYVVIGDFRGVLPFDGRGNGSGAGPVKPPGGTPGGMPDELIGMLELLELVSSIEGNGTISGSGTISGNGTVNGTMRPEEPEVIVVGSEGYLTNGLLIIFTMLLAAIICADIIAQDLSDSSFVLYFSRPVRTVDYLLGKSVGLTWVMWLFCLVPPVAYVLVMMGTQSGDDFSGGLTILGRTVAAGLVTAVFFLPYGLMVSSFTKSKAYAGIGIFMSFFVLTIIAEFFSGSSDKWTLIDPFALLTNFYKILFNGTIPEGIQGTWVGAVMAAFIVVPAVVAFLWVDRKGAGR